MRLVLVRGEGMAGDVTYVRMPLEVISDLLDIVNSTV